MLPHSGGVPELGPTRSSSRALACKPSMRPLQQAQVVTQQVHKHAACDLAHAKDAGG